MKSFFQSIRPLFGGTLSQSQVDGLNALLDATEGQPRAIRAYLLATAFHETAGTMQPIHERGRRSYFDKYEPGTAIGKRLGNTHPGDGYLFRGRGYVQITGRFNYKKASQKLGVDFVESPSRALVPSLAGQILVRGCSEGWFTGKRLSEYINDNRTDFRNARRVVNGMDRAGLIAGHAKKFNAALMDSPKRKPPKTFRLLRWLRWMFGY